MFHCHVWVLEATSNVLLPTVRPSLTTSDSKGLWSSFPWPSTWQVYVYIPFSEKSIRENRMWFSRIGWFIMPLLIVIQQKCWWLHYGLFYDAMFVWLKIQRSSSFTNQQANPQLLIEFPNLLFIFWLDENIPINKSNILEWFACPLNSQK